jgi:hypothetical protein
MDPLEEQYMIRVNRPYCFLYTIIKLYQSSLFRIGRFIQWVISSYHSIASVMLGDLLPYQHRPVLKVEMIENWRIYELCYGNTELTKCFMNP